MDSTVVAEIDKPKVPESSRRVPRRSDIPDDLAKPHQWVHYADGKIPMHFVGNRRAATDDPSTWTTFDTARQYLPLRPNTLGLGYVFREGGGKVGIDLDGCRNPETGEIAEWARPILEKFSGTYMEISPSGKGVKIFAAGRLPTDRTGKRVSFGGNHCGIEAYQHGRYFCVTGRLYGNSPLKVTDCQPSIDWLWETYLRPREGVRRPSKANGVARHVSRDRKTRRARAYLATVPPAIQGQNGSGQTFKAACSLFRFGLDDADAATLLDEYNGRCVPPWSEAELAHKLADASDEVMESGEFGILLADDEADFSPATGKPVGGEFSPGTRVRAGDRDNWGTVLADQGDTCLVRFVSPDGATAEKVLPKTELTPQGGQQSGQPAEPVTVVTAAELLRNNSTLRPPVIDGLLRLGETCNVIASAKFGKTFLVLWLAMCVVLGIPWLGRFRTRRGKVLIIDNELHPETLAARIKVVADAAGLDVAELGGLHVCCARGRRLDIQAIGSTILPQFEPSTLSLVILDAWYRALPEGVDENDNGQIAAQYNLLDHLARQWNCAFAVIHHASKGSQADKRVTDVGSGAGSQSRAADTHLVIRPHRESGAAVLEAATRSFPPLDPIGLRWTYPLWRADDTLDPSELRREGPGGNASGGDDARNAEKLRKVLREASGPLTKRKLRAAAKMSGGKFDAAFFLIEAELTESNIRAGNGANYPAYSLQELGQPGQAENPSCPSSKNMDSGELGQLGLPVQTRELGLPIKGSPSSVLCGDAHSPTTPGACAHPAVREVTTFDGYLRTECQSCGAVVRPDQKISELEKK